MPYEDDLELEEHERPYEELIRLIRASAPPREEMPPALRAKIMRQCDEYEARRRSAWFPVAARPAFAVMTLLLIALGGWLGYRIWEPHKQVATVYEPSSDSPSSQPPQPTPILPKSTQPTLPSPHVPATGPVIPSPTKGLAEMEQLAVQITQAVPKDKQRHVVILGFDDHKGNITRENYCLSIRLRHYLGMIPDTGIESIDHVKIDLLATDRTKEDQMSQAINILRNNLEMNTLIIGAIDLREDNLSELLLYVIDTDIPAILFSTTIVLSSSKKEVELGVKIESDLKKISRNLDESIKILNLENILSSTPLLESIKTNINEIYKYTKEINTQLEDASYSITDLARLLQEDQERILELSESTPVFKHLAESNEPNIRYVEYGRDTITAARTELASLLERIKEEQRRVDNNIRNAIVDDDMVALEYKAIEDRIKLIKQDIKNVTNSTKRIISTEG